MRIKIQATIIGLIAFAAFYYLSPILRKILNVESTIINSYLINLAAIIIIFLTLSLLKLAITKNRFSRTDASIIGGVFLITTILYNAVNFFQNIALTDYNIPSIIASFLMFSILQTFVLLGTKIIIATPTLNAFQQLTGKTENIKIPIAIQIKAMLGLILSLTAIYGFYWLMAYWSIWVFYLGGILPLIIAGFMLRTGKDNVLQEKEHPKLFTLIENVANKVGVRKPDIVCITPDSGIAVTGVIKKKLIIGIAGLHPLNEEQFESIIAHEFGHFYGSDTVIGYLLAYVKVSMHAVLKGLGSLGSIPAFLYIFYLFIWLYKIFFDMVTLAYSRQVEFRADAVAAQISGSDTFANALLDYAAYSTFFEKSAYPGIVKLAQEKKMFKNIYGAGSEAYTKVKIGDLKKEILKEKVHMFSSHPAIKQRMEKVKIFKKRSEKKKTTHSKTLFKDITKLEEEMTKQLTGIMYYKMGLIDEQGKFIKR